MIPFSFSTINGIDPFQSTIATPICRVCTADSVYSQRSYGLSLSVYAWDEVSENPSFTDTYKVFSGNMPIVKTYSGFGFPVHVPSEFSGKPQFGYKLTGYVRSLYGGTATLLAWGEGHITASINGAKLTWDGLATVNVDINTQVKDISSTISGLTKDAWYSFETNYWSRGQGINPIGLALQWSCASLPHAIVLGAGITSLDGVAPTNGQMPLATTTLDNIGRVSLDITSKKSSELRFVLPLAKSSDSIGYQYIPNGDYLEDIESGNTVKKFRYVEFWEGYKIGGSEELVRKFTGQIRDWVLNKNNNTVEIVCLDWMSFLHDAINQGYPDPLDFLVVGYYVREAGGVAGDNKPRTFDAWSLSNAIECLCMNSYIDPVCFIGKKEFVDTGGSTVEGGYLLENLSLDDDLVIELDRPYRYGNIGIAISDITPDDEYEWQMGIGDYLFDQVDKIVKNYGYDWGFDRNGNLFVRALNNPSEVVYWDDFTYSSSPGGWANGTTVRSYRGAYKNSTTDAAWATKHVYGSKFTLLTAVGPNAGTIHVKVYNSDEGTVATFDHHLHASATRYLFDGIDSSSGENPCKVILATGLTYGEYLITLTNTEGSKDHIINGLWVYDVDRTAPVQTFRTKGESTDPAVITELSVDARTEDTRNDCLVVGKLLGEFTTLADTGEETTVNENNPEMEHILSRTVDLTSLASVSSALFCGRPLQSIIVDPQIASQARADWLSYEFVNRYRRASEMKQPQYRMIHNPLLEIGDCIYIQEESTGVIGTSQKLWINGITTTKDGPAFLSALSSDTTEPWPSYEIRPPASLTMYGGFPITNVRITNKGRIGLLNGGINDSVSTILVDNAAGVSTIGYVKLENEVIYYQNKNGATLLNCDRGRQGTSAAAHSDGVSADMRMDPYLTEEVGIAPEIKFDIVVPGYVQIPIEASTGYHVDTLTGMNKQNWDDKRDRLEMGPDNIYRWGMLDKKGDYQQNLGEWINNWGEKKVLADKWYVRDGDFYVQIQHQALDRSRIYSWQDDTNGVIAVRLGRGLSGDWTIDYGAQDCYPQSGVSAPDYPIWPHGSSQRSWGVASWPPSVWSGDENNGLGLKTIFTSDVIEKRLCQIKITAKHYLIGAAVNYEVFTDAFEKTVLSVPDNIIDCSKSFPFYLKPPPYPFKHHLNRKVRNSMIEHGYESYLMGNAILLEITITDNSGRDWRGIHPLFWVDREYRHSNGLPSKNCLGLKGFNHEGHHRMDVQRGDNSVIDMDLFFWGLIFSRY